MNKCGNCGVETSNPNYCSRSCAAKVNNKIPKRRPSKLCGCGKKIRRSVTQCRNCRVKSKGEQPISLFFYARGANRYNGIRGMARTSYRHSGRDRVCHNCGYNKHVEICHIKPICDFPDTTSINVVNGPDNLVALCPNCHWEYDKGLIVL